MVAIAIAGPACTVHNMNSHSVAPHRTEPAAGPRRHGTRAGVPARAISGAGLACAVLVASAGAASANGFATSSPLATKTHTSPQAELVAWAHRHYPAFSTDIHQLLKVSGPLSMAAVSDKGQSFHANCGVLGHWVKLLAGNTAPPGAINGALFKNDIRATNSALGQCKTSVGIFDFMNVMRALSKPLSDWAALLGRIDQELIGAGFSNL